MHHPFSPLRRLSFILLSVAALAMPAVAQDASTPVIRIGSMIEPLNLDNTQGAGTGVTEAFNDNVYEGLYRLNDDGTVVPWLVTAHSVSADGLTYTFTLRSGVKFHSGDMFTAADAKYSIERVIADSSKSSRKSSLAVIDHVEAPAPDILVVKLKAKSISLPYNLSYVWMVNHNDPDLTAKEDGTGPYVLGDWRRGSALSLKPFAGYWGDKPSNGGAVFNYFTDSSALTNALLTHQVDLITSVTSPDALDAFSDASQFTIAEGTSTTKNILAFNDRVAPFDKVDVRKALARAVDKKKLLDAVWGGRGLVISSFVPPTDPWYEDLSAVDPYDPASAKDLLAKAGYPNGFTFTLDTPNYDPHPLVAEFLKAEYAKIGVTVNIRIITPNEWYTKIYKAHNFEATLQEHVNHRDIVFYGDPNFYWGYDNPKVVDLIKAAEASDTEAEQTDKLRQANRLITEDAASNWFFLNPQIVVSTKDVTGYGKNALNSQFFLRHIVKAGE